MSSSISSLLRDHSSIALGLDLQYSSLRLFNDLGALCPTIYLFK